MAKRPTREEAQRLADAAIKTAVIVDPLAPLPKKKTAAKPAKKTGKK